jgi:peptidyl-tRNA hydrolase, PTH1 family
LIKVLVGLGNPGQQYLWNRHNIGFLVVDRFREFHSCSAPRFKFSSECYDCKIEGQQLYLLKPQTYMNKSGSAIRELIQFYKIQPEECLVIHDDLDLPSLSLRLKQGGGHGGHNGLKSLDAAIGPNYHRLRIGIGHPGDKDRVADYVLSDFFKDEKQDLDILLDKIANALPLLINNQNQAFLEKIKG